MNDIYIEKLEQKNHIKLPEDYKRFLKAGVLKIDGKIFPHGKTCEDVCFEDIETEDDEKINFVAFHLFHYEDNKGTHDLNDHNCVLFNKRIPDDFITIGCDLISNQICLGVKGEYSGKVYLWEMEQEADYGQPFPYYGNMTLITNT
ncbi:hypothetical protein BWK58_15445, partial [Flavobacterium columnare]